jgi:PAS domain S-box-containing protein
MEILDLLFNKHPHPIIIYNVDSLQIEDVNESAVEKYGYSEEEFLQLTIKDIRPKEDIPKLMELLEREGQTHVIDRGVIRHQTKRGDIIHVDLTVQEFEQDQQTLRVVNIRDVTNRKKIHQELERKHNRLVNAQKLAKAGWWELDPQTADIKWSKNLYDILDLSEEDIQDESDFRSYVHPEDISKLDEAKQHLRDSREPVEYFLRVKTKDDEVVHLKCRAQSKWNEGEIQKITGVTQNVTSERKSLLRAEQSEIKVKKQKEFANKLIDNLPDVFLLMDADGNVVRWNSQFEETTGYSSEQIEGQPMVSFFAEDEQDELTQKFMEAFTNGSTDPEGTLLTADGSGIPHKLNGIEFEVENEPFVAVVGIDISKQISYQKKLEKKSRSLARAQQIGKIGSFDWDVPHQMIEWSDMAYKIYGLDKDDSQQKKLDQYFDVVHEKDRAHVEENIKRILNGNGFQNFEHRITHDEEIRHVLQRGTAEYNDDGEAVRIFGTVQDITKQKKRQQKLEEHFQLFDNLFAKAPVAMMRLDGNQQVHTVNDSFEELFGYTQEDLEGKMPLYHLMKEEEHERIPKLLERSFSNLESRYYEGQRTTKKGEVKNCLIASVPVEIEGDVQTVFAIYVDMTEQKEIQQNLEKSLEEKEILLAEIHHRVKNNLAIISGLLKLEAMNWSSEEAVKSAFKESQLRIQSIAMIHEHLYESDDLANLRFNHYVDEMANLVTNTFGLDNGEIELNVESDDFDLNINQAIPTALILNELITNAYEHAFTEENGGTLNITMGENSKTMKLIVEDNGEGLPEDFDIETATSLGMTLINRLTRQLDGELEIERREEGGSRFQLTFEKSSKSGSGSNYFT